MSEIETQVTRFIESSRTVPVFKPEDGLCAISLIDIIDKSLNLVGGKGFKNTSQDTPLIPGIEEVQNRYVMEQTPHFVTDKRTGEIIGSGGFAHDAYSDKGNVGYVSKRGSDPIKIGDIVDCDNGKQYRVVTAAGHNYGVTDI